MAAILRKYDMHYQCNAARERGAGIIGKIVINATRFQSIQIIPYAINPQGEPLRYAYDVLFSAELAEQSYRVPFKTKEAAEKEIDEIMTLNTAFNKSVMEEKKEKEEVIKKPRLLPIISFSGEAKIERIYPRIYFYEDVRLRAKNAGRDVPPNYDQQKFTGKDATVP